MIGENNINSLGINSAANAATIVVRNVTMLAGFIEASCLSRMRHLIEIKWSRERFGLACGGEGGS